MYLRPYRKPLKAFTYVLCALSTLWLVGCSSGDNAATDGNAEKIPPNSLKLDFIYSSEKKHWINHVTAAFNKAEHKLSNGKTIYVSISPAGSGEMVSDVLAETHKPHIISPASEVFVELGNAESQLKYGKDLLADTQDLVLSPVVIAMWKPMAEALGWGTKPVGWSDVLELTKDPRGWSTYDFPQWGKFKFGHTHPDYSNSGLISLLAQVYAATGKIRNLTLEDAEQPATAEYLSAIQQAIVHYGRSTGFFGEKMFSNGPEYLSAAVLYENMVIQSYNKQDIAYPVVAIYPKEGTFWSDHPAGIVERDWVTAEHREAAQIYLDYLLAPIQQEEAMEYGFRPADVSIPLGFPFDVAHGVDPQQPQTTLSVPSAKVIQAVKGLWHQNKKRGNVLLVLDTSGSMGTDNKIDNARNGALQLLNMLHEQDIFSLLPFNSDAEWAIQNTPVEAERPRMENYIKSLFPNGGTALYDAIQAAYDFALANPHGDKITAIVVLSDGDDTNSRMALSTLLSNIAFDSEVRPIRVFTIGYGEGADKTILTQIADTTQAKFYEGSTVNIKDVFKEISTFF